MVTELGVVFSLNSVEIWLWIDAAIVPASDWTYSYPYGALFAVYCI